jgi:hypothetical protein
MGWFSQYTIYLAAVANIMDHDLLGLGVNLVYDPIVAHPKAIKPFSTRQLNACRGNGSVFSLSMRSITRATSALGRGRKSFWTEGLFFLPAFSHDSQVVKVFQQLLIPLE